MADPRLIEQIVREQMRLSPRGGGSFGPAQPPAMNTPALRQPRPPLGVPPAAGMGMLGLGGMTAAGMTIPSMIGQDPGADFLRMLDQQSMAIGPEPISSEQIAAMLGEFSAPPSPAPEIELFSAMEAEPQGIRRASGGSQKSFKSSSNSKRVPPKDDVEEVSREFSAPQGRKLPPIDVGGPVPEMDFTEVLLDELTQKGSPMRRGSLPKRVKKPR